jgi:hypothetical protein
LETERLKKMSTGPQRFRKREVVRAILAAQAAAKAGAASPEVQIDSKTGNIIITLGEPNEQARVSEPAANEWDDR